MELRNSLTQEELDKLFDNGYLYQEFLDAPPIKRIIMLSDSIKTENPKYFITENKFHEIRIDKWVKIGEGEGVSIWSDGEHIWDGNNN
jgi:hypothetical protein